MLHKELLVGGWQACVAEPGFQGLQQRLHGTGQQLEQDGGVLVTCRSHSSFSCKLETQPTTYRQASRQDRCLEHSTKFNSEGGPTYMLYIGHGGSHARCAYFLAG